MSCYHPLKGFILGEKSNGKKNIKITSYDVDHIECRNGVYYSVSVPFVSPYSDRVVRDYNLVPCGKCIGCRLTYSRQWATRCMLELMYHTSAYFVTLTYDNDNLPVNYYADPETGEGVRNTSLRKRDFQLFMKRLRKQTGQNLRYFACGEYGDKTFRPHYHAIIFGLELPEGDLLPYKKSNQGYQYYNSKLLSEIWKKGFVVVGEVTWETCAYTARYVVKKLKGDESVFYTEFNLEPPFVLMSRRNGIGYQYYADHPDVGERSFIYIPTKEGSRKETVPKYFYNQFDVDYPEESAILKLMRQQAAQDTILAELAGTDLDEQEYREVKERAHLRVVSSLRRNLESGDV